MIRRLRRLHRPLRGLDQRSRASLARPCIAALGLLAVLSVARPAAADEVITQNLIVQNSACVGTDCEDGHNFGSDTLVLRENNLRIYFQDTSESGDFPARDWRLVANGQASGGGDYFAIEDVNGSRVPFRTDADAPSNSVRIGKNGVGIGASAPAVDLHVVSGTTPTLRLQQDQSDDHPAWSWDVAANEANFFIRDVSGGGTLPFRIVGGAPGFSLNIAASGAVGFGTIAPGMSLHTVADDTPGLRLEQSDGQAWDVAGNESNFFVRDVTNRDQLPLRIRPGAPTNSVVVDTDGELGLGTAAPLGALHVVSGKDYGAASDARGQLVLENRAASDKYMLNVANVGAVMSIYRDQSVASTWVETFGSNPDLAGTAWTLTEAGNPTALTVRGNGNVVIAGLLYQGSSRFIKEGIAAVDARNVLDRLRELVIARWRYIGDAAEHIGPMAEDFFALFGLGVDGAHISPSDLAGVALGGVQALAERSDAQSDRISALERENAELRARLDRLERLVTASGGSR